MKIFSLMKNKTKKTFNIVVMGDSYVGKTALSIGFVKEIFLEQYDPTIEEFQIKEMNIDEDHQIVFKIIDTAGSVTYYSFDYFIF